MKELPEQVNVPQAADILGISTRTLYRWLRQGRLTSVTGPDGRRAMCRDDVTAMARAKARQVARQGSDMSRQVARQGSDMSRQVARQGSDMSRLHRELSHQRVLLEQLQQRLDWQAELLEALVHLSPTPSLEALVRKREAIEQLNPRSDDHHRSL